MQYTMGNVDMSASLQARRETITNPHKKRSVDWHGLIIRLCGYSGNANANYLNTFQLEKGNSKENVDKLIFNCVNSIYIKKVYII